MLSSSTHAYIQSNVRTSPTTQPIKCSPAPLSLLSTLHNKQSSNTPINKSNPTSSATYPYPNPNNQKLSTMPDDGWCPTWRPFSGAHPRRYNNLKAYGHGSERLYSRDMGGSDRLYGSMFRQTPADDRWSSTMSGGGYFGRAAPYDRAHRNRLNSGTGIGSIRGRVVGE